MGKQIRKMTDEEIDYFYGDDVEVTPADAFGEADEWPDDIAVEVASINTSAADALVDDGALDLEGAMLDTMCYERDPKRLTEMFKALHDPNKVKAEIAGQQIYDQLHKWILSIGHKHFPTWMRNQQEQEELVGEAWEAVFRAVPKYDPYQSAPSTYFYRPIVHNMSEYINKFLKKTTGYNTGIQRQIKQAMRLLASEGNRNPSVLDIAYETGIKPSIVRKSMEFTGATETRSLDEMPVDPGEYSATGKSARARDDYDMSATAYSERYNPYARLVKQEESNALAAAMAELPRQQCDVLCRLYGIGRDKQTYTDISHELNMPTNQIKLIEANAKSRLKMNTNLCSSWKGVATQVKEAFDFEPLAITPDAIGTSMMDALAENEDLF